MPVYNEARTIDEILRLVTAVPIEKEVVVVDDGSTDGTREILSRWDGRAGVRVILHPSNLGKGRAVRTAIDQAQGEILLIQDADLEYDPSDYPAILRPIEAGRADVVYGSRYKAFHRRVVPSLDLESRRFGFDAEFTVKVARGRFRVFEVPVSYFARSRAEGKKIRLKDGFAALGALVRHTFEPSKGP
jgi:glycosyltransferase involved in cell wall biosynthesis